MPVYNARRSKIDTEGHDIIILHTLYPYLHNIRSIIFEFTVFWYGEDMNACISRSCDALRHLHSVYAYVYMLSRRGPPNLLQLRTVDELDLLVNTLYKQRLQVDILVTNTRITTVPIRYMR